MQLLEDEGLVRLSENGYSRYLVSESSDEGQAQKALRIGFLMAEPLNEQIGQFHHLIVEIQVQLERLGFTPFFFHETLSSLGYDVKRMSSGILKAPMDACLVVSGSREILEWFGSQEIPCLALFGRADGLSLASAGPDKAVAFVETVRQLVALGHRRIVLLNRKDRRFPGPGLSERAFIGELKANGIGMSSFNLPDWEETPEGLCALLAELFRVTPPSALVIDEVQLWVAVQQYLVAQSIRVPEQLSMVATDYDPAFTWCSPSVAHISWDNEPIVRRVTRWAMALKKGRRDVRQVLSPAQFVRGGTVGPAS